MSKFSAHLLAGALLVVCSTACCAALSAQTSNPSAEPDGFFERWQARASATQALQPKWIVPVVSPYPMLIQVFRSDFTRQISPTHATTWNLGTTRGLNLIPFARTEVDILVPPYFEHDNKTADGFGDFSVSGKYRILTGNEKHGNYLLSAFVTATVPTGSYSNGATDAVVTPALTGGKGFGKFDAFTTISGGLPTADVKTIGRTIVTNSVFQYHVQKYIWPEVEINSTAWYGSAKDGKVQTFVTPGLMLGKYSIHPNDKASRLGYAAGVAFQDSATHYHTYNHSLIFTGRFLF